MGVEATRRGKKGVCKMAAVQRLHLAKDDSVGTGQSQSVAWK